MGKPCNEEVKLIGGPADRKVVTVPKDVNKVTYSYMTEPVTFDEHTDLSAELPVERVHYYRLLKPGPAEFMCEDWIKAYLPPKED